jgi:hypothetical protein
MKTRTWLAGFLVVLAHSAASAGSTTSVALTRSQGFQRPIVLTLQGVLQDGGASNAAGYSTTNAVVLRIQ